MGRKSTVDKKVVIELFENGMTYRAIAKELNSNEDAIRMIIKRNAPKDLTKKREERKNRCMEKLDTGNELEFKLEHSNLLNSNDLKEIREEKNHGIMPNESVGDYSFIMWNRQSYKKSNGKKFIFDESRGKRTYAVPQNY